jgi:hypothetical protein
VFVGRVVKLFKALVICPREPQFKTCGGKGKRAVSIFILVFQTTIL